MLVHKIFAVKLFITDLTRIRTRFLVVVGDMLAQATAATIRFSAVWAQECLHLMFSSTMLVQPRLITVCETAQITAEIEL